MNTAGRLARLLAVGPVMATAQAHAWIGDLMIGEANLGNSGDATERRALADPLGVIVNTVTIQRNNNAPVAVSNCAGSWYIDVASSQPGYVLLRFGIGGTGATVDTFILRNMNVPTRFVWLNDQVQCLTGGNCGTKNQNACTIDGLSHVTTFAGNGT